MSDLIILDTAKAVLDSLVVTAANLKAGCLVGQAKEEIKATEAQARKSLSGVQVQVPLGSEPTESYVLYTACHVGDIAKARSRSALITELDATIAGLNLLVAAQPEGQLTNRLAELEEIIGRELENAANSSINVGLALAEAREEFDSQQDFLVWASDKFSIKKSQAFNLMKVAKVFGTDTRFDGVAMRVLNLLAGESDEVIGQAAKLAAEGKLTTPALKGITGGKAAESKAPEAPTAAPEATEAAGQCDGLPPFEIDAPQAAPVAESEIQALTRQVSKLLEENEKLTALLANAGKTSKAKQLPLLPHFTSNCFATRLGLTQQDANQKAARAAYREITKHYTPLTNSEVFELVTEALDFITKEAKAA